jgi:hypothetical protein
LEAKALRLTDRVKDEPDLGYRQSGSVLGTASASGPADLQCGDSQTGAAAEQSAIKKAIEEFALQRNSAAG